MRWLYCSTLFDAMGTDGKTGAAAYPVLVLDEANMLMTWSSEYPRELKQFLQFCIKVGKQNNTCHVLMATSEHGFLQWLEDTGVQ